MSNASRMKAIIDCWALAEKRAKHLCAFETLDLSFRLKKPTKEEVRKAWHRLAMKIHPDKNIEHSVLATEATRCLNLAKQHLFEEHFGDAAARVLHKHTWREEARAKQEAAEVEAESTEAAAAGPQAEDVAAAASKMSSERSSEAASEASGPTNANTGKEADEVDAPGHVPAALDGSSDLQSDEADCKRSRSQTPGLEDVSPFKRQRA